MQIPAALPENLHAFRRSATEPNAMQMALSMRGLFQANPDRQIGNNVRSIMVDNKISIYTTLLIIKQS